ncbi:MAG TPA: enolase C-terminal domain-like protein [Chthonomonadaceae bacterium]|nr:enolase C-terminal domain-like protein [Chthonomonadaceae bacterium]
MVGQPLDALTGTEGVLPPWRGLEYPLWDLAGRRAGQPVFRMVSGEQGCADPLRVPCYDTSLYFDDLHLPTDAAAAACIAAQAADGLALGHRAFKIKVGRGARHMPLDEGTARDIAIIRAVRETVGEGCPLMIDANNGYNLNLAKRVLRETAGCRLTWIEEAFHEDPVLYRDLKEWMAAEGLAVLIADGEGEASARLLDWAAGGLIDVVQYDIFGHGFERWRETSRTLEERRTASGAGRRVRTAPHHYGCHIGNYAACHLAAALPGFAYAEWDEASTPGIGAAGYAIEEGFVHVPETPGFGLELDEQAFLAARTDVYAA